MSPTCPSCLTPNVRPSLLDSVAQTLTAYRGGVQIGQRTGYTGKKVVLGNLFGDGTYGFVGKLASVAYCNAASTDLVAAFTAWANNRAGL